MSGILNKNQYEGEAIMSKFKFTVGPWNVHTGADSYGPETRNNIDLETKFKKFADSRRQMQYYVPGK